jgi:hypothetical protein
LGCSELEILVEAGGSMYSDFGGGGGRVLLLLFMRSNFG